MQLFNVKKSNMALKEASTTITYGPSMPRGRIYDRNYNIIVDNVGVNEIDFKNTYLTDKEMLKVAYNLAKNLDVSYVKLTNKMLKDFWLVNNPLKGDAKITKKETELYKMRKLKASALEKLKEDRITKKELDSYNELDKEAAYIYFLMNDGYAYDEKVIKENASDKEYAYVAQNKDTLKGVTIGTSWERTYPYGDTVKQILGSVSTSDTGVPEELKDKYVSAEDSLKDRVGISYLEQEYDDVLRGKKDKYEVKNGVKKLVSKGSRGDDVVLSIDINLQKALEDIISEELINAKNDLNTDYYNNASVVITDPKTGNILAMASKQLIDGKISDYTTSLLTSSNTPGSIVKGASMLVGYSTGNLKIGDVLYDKCIKIKNTKEKCSWSNSLGALNDINALKYSSNSYQFQLALKVAGAKYYYDMPLKVSNDVLDKYRIIFKSVGLGAKSGIDLPNETEGYKGKKVDAGLLLNYAIGQYDTYTALQLSSYINTLANDGERLKLSLLKEVRNKTNDGSLGSIKKTYKKVILNESDISKVYYERIKLGFTSVMQGFLGRGYMGDAPNPAGKTGTAESFYDADGNGVVDTETYTKSFVGYAPYDNPVMSIASISPHVSYKNGRYSYISSVNERITSRICNKFFEIYK